MTLLPGEDRLHDWFPGGYARDRQAAISIAMELGLHDDAQNETPEPAGIEPSRLEWSFTSGIQVNVVRQGYRFAGLVQQVGDEWAILGLLTPETPHSATGEARVREIFDDHAHRIIGREREFGAALQRAERFALHQPPPDNRCDCPSLDAEPERLIDRVKVALRLLGYDPALTHLEESPNGIVRGVLRSGRFAHQSQLERQSELRNQLERELGPDAMERIGLFTTLTPAEAE